MNERAQQILKELSQERLTALGHEVAGMTRTLRELKGEVPAKDIEEFMVGWLLAEANTIILTG